MSKLNQPGSFESDSSILLLSFGAIAVVGWLWFSKIVVIVCTVLYWIWRTADFHFVHAYAATRINLLADTANNASNVTGMQLLDVLNQTSGILFIFLIPMFVAGVIGMIGHPSLPFRSKRVVNVHTLPKIMSRFVPATAPILADSTTADLLMNDTRPEHRWAIHPEEFAQTHGLISARVLDREKAREIFTSQLGNPLNTPDTLLDYEKALLTVFGLQLFLNDRKTARRLLDQLNLSCVGKRSKGSSALKRPAFSLTDKYFPQVWNTPQMKEIVRTHRYARTALTGMLANDIRLPTSQFRWLKGIDRTLWYALHSADTLDVYIEGAGVLAQMRFERVLRAAKLELDRDYVEEAINGLQQDLQSIGLVHEFRTKKHESVDKSPDWKEETVSAPINAVQGDNNTPQPKAPTSESEHNPGPPKNITETVKVSAVEGLHAAQGSDTVHTSNAEEDGFTVVGDDDDEDNIHHQYTSGFVKNPTTNKTETETETETETHTYPHIEDADTDKFDLA